MLIRLASYFLVALAASLVLVPLCRHAALVAGIAAQTHRDRWHGRPTPLLGGVAIAVTVLALHVAYLGWAQLPVLLVAAAAMFVLGLVDDLVTLSPATKLVTQIAIASLLVATGSRLSWASSPPVDALLTVFWIVGITNAFNLLDNMDGLCAGTGLVAGGGVLATMVMNGASAAETGHLVLLLGALAGFLVYNFHPASIFMGDSGSLFIGLNLALLAVDSLSASHARSGLLSVMLPPTLLLLVPIFDTSLVTVSRILSGRSAAQGGRDHASHRLVAIGWSERGAVVSLWVLSALGGLLALAVRHIGDDRSSLAAAIFVCAVAVLAIYLAQVHVYDEQTALDRRGAVTALGVSVLRRRRVAQVLVDLCLVSAAYYAAYAFRLGQVTGSQLTALAQSVPIVMGVQIVCLALAGGYGHRWRAFALPGVLALARGVGLGTLVNVSLLLYVYRFAEYSRAVFLIYPVVLMAMLVGVRGAFRLIGDAARRHHPLAASEPSRAAARADAADVHHAGR